jgi:integrase
LTFRLLPPTGARRGGAIGLTLGDLDELRLPVRLMEKGGRQRRQPVSPTLSDALRDHAAARGSTESDEQAGSPRRP